MTRQTPDLLSMTQAELAAFCAGQGLPAYRAAQLFAWLQRGALYEEMTNLPLALRRSLAEAAPLRYPRIAQKFVSRLDGTVKYVYELFDGEHIESVVMRYHHGTTICISSQVGCRMGCRFCASTLDGLERNLTTAEMLDQIYRIQEDTGERVSNLVVMGTGEPMDNYDNLVRFVRLLSSQEGLNISQRNITVSTCGIVPNMYKLADEGLQITLALSLHAPNDEKRRELMPIANKYSIDEILDACRNYFAKTGRRITFEYSLVGGKNDSEADAKELSARISDINCHVNLIPVNPIKERDYVKSTKKVVENFKNKLEKYGINVTIRREMGADIDGACGQLRKSFIDKSNEQP